MANEKKAKAKDNDTDTDCTPTIKRRIIRTDAYGDREPDRRHVIRKPIDWHESGSSFDNIVKAYEFDDVPEDVQ